MTHKFLNTLWPTSLWRKGLKMIQIQFDFHTTRQYYSVIRHSLFLFDCILSISDSQPCFISLSIHFISFIVFFIVLTCVYSLHTIVKHGANPKPFRLEIWQTLSYCSPVAVYCLAVTQCSTRLFISFWRGTVHVCFYLRGGGLPPARVLFLPVRSGLEAREAVRSTVWFAWMHECSGLRAGWI